MLFKNKLVFACFLLLFCFSSWGANNNILVLYNYQPLLSNTVALGKSINKGIYSVLPDAKIFSEYYDKTRFPSETHEEIFFNYLAAKYKNNPPQVILAHLETATVAFKLRDAVAPHARVLYDLPLEDDIPHWRPDFDVFLPLEMHLLFDKNIELYRTFFPELRNVFLISDEHPLSKNFVQKIRETILKMNDPLNLTVWTDDDVNVILKRMKKLRPELSLVVFSCFARRFGGGMKPGDINYLVKESSVPILFLEDVELGDSNIGGYLFSYQRRAFNVGVYLAKMASGVTDAKLDQASEELVKFRINNAALKRFSIKEELIPQGADVQNQPKLFIDIHYYLIMGSLVLVLVLITGVAWFQFKRYQNEKKFRVFFDETFQFLGLLDQDGRIVDANKTALDFIRKKMSDVAGEFFWDTPWWTHAQTESVRLKQGIAKAQNGELVRFNTYHLNAEGLRVEIDFTIKPVINDEKVVGFVVEGRDITERVTKEKVLKESEEIFHSLFVNSPEPIWIIENNVFVDCNAACVHALGYSDTKEVLHLHPALLSPPLQEDGKDSHVKADEMMALCIEKGVQRFEWQHKKKNGDVFSVFVTLTRVNLGHRTLISCTWKDITDEKRIDLEKKEHLEKILSEKQLVERSNQLKTALLRSAGLEMRDPLTSIIGAAHILQEGGLKLEQEGIVRLLLRSSSRMAELVNTLLDLSLIEEHKVKILHEPFSLKKEIDYLRKEFSLRALDKGLLFEIIEDDVLIDVIWGDKRRLRQVLYQLLDNAIKFTETGSVTLKIGRLASDPKLIQFAIIDTGIGIPKYNIPNLLEIDGSLNKMLEHKLGSGGLGLGVVQELVNYMGGKIGILSSPSTGTTIHFALSLKTGEGPLPEDEVVATKNTKSLKILIADDSDETRNIYFQFLKKTPHQIDFSSNGSDALERFKHEHYDLILLDIQMPHLTGYEVVREIRKIEREKNLSRTFVVAVTVHAFEEDKLLAYDSGFDLHLSKPIDKKALLNLFDGFKD